MLETTFLSFDKLFVENLKSNTTNDMPCQHYHDCYEIFLMVEGERYFFFDDSCYTLKHGDLMIVKPFVLHYGKSLNIPYYERCVINFNDSDFNCILNNDEINEVFNDFDSKLIHLNEKQFNAIYEYFKKAETYTKNNDGISHKLLYFNVLELINITKEIPNVDSSPLNQHLSPDIITTIHYINNHYHETITLEQLAQLVHISKYHFCRVFRKMTGATFMEYLHNVRLSKAHRLLMETDLSITDIAERTGFSSVSHLSRMFSKAYGTAPSKFKNKKMSIS